MRQDITVTVTNGNESPTITSDGGAATAAVDVAENTTAVTDVTSVDDSDSEGAGLTYSLSPTLASFDNGLFSLAADGNLSFLSAPDFESPDDANRDNRYVLQVTVTDSGGLTDSQDIVVTVTGVIDEVPTITSDGGGATASVSVPENQPVVTDVDSVDLDGETENGGGLVYSLTTVAGGGVDNGLFTLDVATGFLGFTVAPDFDVPGDANGDNDYEVQVTVTDGAALTDVQDITVTITNANDVAPVITSDGGGATAAVNAAENQTAVTDVNAIDDVDSEGAGLVYSLTSTAGGADNGLFALDASTGVLSFASAPDFENPLDVGADNDYEVQVTVTDGATLTDVQDITVTVTDVNEAPTITSAATADAAENQTAAIDVDSIDDADSEGAGLTYTLSTVFGGGVDNGQFTLATDGVLTFTSAPDFEIPGDTNLDNDYEVQVTVTDSGSLTGVQDITVTVTNLIDNAPTITTAATVNAPENQTAVIDIDSADADGETENGGGLTYSLTTVAGGDDNALFSVNPATGFLSFLASPDFENAGDANSDNDYLVQVTVTDGGGLTGTQNLVVTVTGANDAPVITSAATANAAENQVAVIDVNSSDQDGGAEGVASYSLTSNGGGGADNALFSVNPATGVVTFKVAPDFENPLDANADNDYLIQVTVTDGGGLTATQNIVVTVTDVNEAPTITSDGGGATAAVDAAENQTAVTTVTATDEDVPAQTLGYSITGGADELLFDVGSASGVLTFKVAPDFENAGDVGGNNVYDVQVTVTDSGLLTDVQDIAVTVTDVNDAPTITSAATADAAENQTSATTVTATDEDLPAQTLGYSITGGADAALFDLVGATGVLTFKVAPDFENPADAGGNNVYDVQVTVTDSGSGTLTDVQDIAITVTDVNDAPTITSDGGDATAAVDAAENQTSVTTVTATDEDLPAQTLGYSITGGADAALFDLVGATGVLTFKVAPDFENPVDAGGNNVYDVQVTVTDSGLLTDVQDIAVTVTDVNEVPTITSPATASAAENQTAVSDVDSSDLDGETENGGGLTYAFSTDSGGADNALFGLDEDTGILTFSAAPNFEDPADADTDNDYEVQVTVTDAGGLTDTQDIVVTVTDVNDAPTITSAATVDADENQTTVTDIESSDQDGDIEGAGLAYSFTTVLGGGADNGLFTLNPATGVLTFIVAPDAENPADANTDNDYEVQVTVTDSGGLVDVQNLVVSVTNLNDNAPTITSNGGGATAAVNAAENQTAVTDVNSLDLDGDTEGGGLTYSFTTVSGGGVDNDEFALAADGTLTFDSAPDFENPSDADTNNAYLVQVTVTDSGGLTDRQNITVTVTNVNDAPTITSDGGDATAAVDAAENQTAVTTVTATDEDLPAQTLGYTITGGADAALFDVGSASGVLTFKVAPDFENPTDADPDGVYEVRVTVTDGLLTDVQDITVTVTDVNDAPTITSSATADAAENQTAVIDVESSDDADSEGSGLTYAFSTTAGGGLDNGLFDLAADGTLTFAAAPDFEDPDDTNGDNVYVVQVTVTDSTGLPSGLTDVQDITVTVTDVNEAPTITSASTADAAENQVAVINVDAFDPEGETENGGGLVYSLSTVSSGGVDNGLFTLNVATGALTFKVAPDFEAPADDDTDNDYEVQVTVTDSGSLTGVQDITVSVTNLNDNPPEITSDGGGAIAAVSAAENQTAVTDVESVDLDGDVEGAGLTYSFTTVFGGGVDNDVFALAADGTLTFDVAPDFEDPSDDNSDNTYSVQVTVTDSGGFTDTQEIAVSVTNLNDNSPEITSAATANAAENQTAVIDVQSGDPDGDAEGSGLTYSFSTVSSGGVDNGVFSLNAATGVLTFAVAPDFENPSDAGTNNVYDVQVTVTDSGGLTDVQNIAVTVTDANDAPTIDSDGGEATASVDVDENQTLVTDVDSSDQDADSEGAGLTYSLTTAFGGGVDNGLFTLNTATGELVFTTAPDFENPLDTDTDNAYSVQVTVTDSGTATDVQEITVNVTNLNDNAPEITSDGGGATAAVDAAENQTSVTDVDSTDADGETENGGGLTYSLTTVAGGVDNGLFTVNPATGVVTFKVAPDFENPGDANTDNDYEVQVTVTDGASATDRQDITVTVTDLNDNPPVITSNGGGATAAVNAAENQLAVTDVNSSDPDGQTEGFGLTYSLTTAVGGGVDNGLFTLIEETGVLTFTSAPDFENPSDANANNAYLVQVTVTDSGGLTDRQNITVTVTDVNDAPTITSDAGGATAAVDAAENQTAVTTVTATDEDLPAQTLGYSITGGADELLFSVDSGTGVLTFDTAPDFENPGDAGGNNVFDVQVTVTDSGSGTLSDVQDIAITVTDVNESPTITSAATADAVENQTAVTTVTATDEDVPAQTLEYSITGGADELLFDVGSASGVLTFKVAPDFENPTDADPDGVYEVQVTVTDGLLTDVQDIVVTVTDVNESPTITSDGGGATAAVDAAENQTAVTTVTATDEDLPAQTLGYSITGGADELLFDVGSTSGVLTFKVAPDFESPTDADPDGVYEVQVTVTDGLFTDVQDIAVTVTDGNDVPTIISAATVNAAENQTAVIDVASIDDSDTEGAGLSYALTGGADESLFSVVPGTGVLTFDAAPDFENPADADPDDVYEVQVTVTDSGSLTDVQDIAVTVTDVNDAPTITSAATADAAENQTSVTTVTATDEDVPAQTLEYSITGGADELLFDVGSMSGVLTFKVAPDFENPTDADPDGVYEVQVTVTDGLLTDVQDIVVTVTDVNESPTITSDGGGATAAVDAAENQTAVTTVTATDEDVPAQTLGYSITGGADELSFDVGSTSGVLTFKVAPDFENAGDVGGNNVYDVQVTVTDGLLTDVQDIAITVTNLNDSAPTITSDGAGATAAVSAPENQTAVTDVQSTDADGPTENGGGLTYSLTGGADELLFSVDPDSGVLTFNDAPDFENPTDADPDGVYEVQVTVTDGLLTDVQDIAVTVTDGNDVPTIISAATVNAAENQTAVIDVASTDDSDSEGAGLSYALTGGADESLFSVVPGTGVLTFDAAPDFENPADADPDGVYEVQVTVTDSGSLTDVQDIVVTVTDGNDAPTMTPDAPSLTGTPISTTSAVTLVSDLVTASTILDEDAGATVGIAITGRTGAGTWQYSTNGAAGPWLAVGARSDGSARVLLPTSAIRYVAPATGETATITYRGWDTTGLNVNGAAGVNTVPNGGTTPFSSNIDVAELLVTGGI